MATAVAAAGRSLQAAIDGPAQVSDGGHHVLRQLRLVYEDEEMELDRYTGRIQKLHSDSHRFSKHVVADCARTMDEASVMGEPKIGMVQDRLSKKLAASCVRLGEAKIRKKLGRYNVQIEALRERRTQLDRRIRNLKSQQVMKDVDGSNADRQMKMLYGEKRMCTQKLHAHNKGVSKLTDKLHKMGTRQNQLRMAMVSNLAAAINAARIVEGEDPPPTEEIQQLISSCVGGSKYVHMVSPVEKKIPKQCCTGVKRCWKFTMSKDIGGAFHNHVDGVLKRMCDRLDLKNGERLKSMRVIFESTGMWSDPWDRNGEDAIPEEIADNNVPPIQELEHVYMCMRRNWRRWAARGHCGSESEREAARAEIRKERIERARRRGWPMSKEELEKIDMFLPVAEEREFERIEMLSLVAQSHDAAVSWEEQEKDEYHESGP
jgi:hypothetical protein